MLLNEYDILSEQSNQVSLLMFNGIEQESNVVLRLDNQLAKIHYDFDDLFYGKLKFWQENLNYISIMRFYCLNPI